MGRSRVKQETHFHWSEDHRLSLEDWMKENNHWRQELRTGTPSWSCSSDKPKPSRELATDGFQHLSDHVAVQLK